MSAAAATDRTSRPGLWWTVPAVCFFGVFALLPMVLVAYLSFTSWKGLGFPHFIGLVNWKRLVNDSQLWQSLRISVVFTVLSWLIQTVLSLLLGVWASGRQRNRAVLSAVFFLPLVM